MTPNNIPVDRVRIFDQAGNALAEFKTRVDRSWVIGNAGRAQFTVPTNDSDIVSEKVLRFGNWLLVENSQLPSWVGVIDVTRRWSPRDVTVSAYGVEHVIGWRRGPLEQVVEGAAGYLFGWLLDYVNAQHPTVIQRGDIDETGTQRQETFNPTLLSVDLQRIFKRSGEEYRWRPVIDEYGRLVVYGDWLPSIGGDTGAMLHEGKHGGNLEISGSIITEDGPIENDILGYGDGLTWQSRPINTVADEDSIFLYGLRQTSIAYQGVTTIGTVTTNALERLSQYKQPNKKFLARAINVGNTFQYIDLGNTFTLQLQNSGFTDGLLGYISTVRILGMRYDPLLRNKIELVLEEV